MLPFENDVRYSKTLPPELIHLLWRKPFHFLYTCNNNSKSNNQCYCSKDKRKYQAANLLMTYLLIKRDKEFVKKGIIKAEGESITFNYLELLSVLDLREAIEDWNQWNNMSKESSPLTEDLFDEEKSDEKGLWFPNLKYLQVDYVEKEEFKELSLILSSILIKYSPLII
ncbi:hypothetical protein C1646_755850 [Rhizophagus diaphanus]|nr:hypothetical protein C1646_755850 [Rhizophagus diaphanus] [Rhizophagus sp. MUCL 43196]